MAPGDDFATLDDDLGWIDRFLPVKQTTYMMSSFRFNSIAALVLLTSFTVSRPVFAQTETTQPGRPKLVSAHLEYPLGRFREDSAPKLFKWHVTGNPSTVTLKIYKQTTSSTDSGDSRPYIKRFDLMATVDSVTLPEGALPNGKYSWTVEAFDDVSPRPLTVERAAFEIAAIAPFDLRARRAGLFAGASRGTYASTDPAYTVKFDTTPNTYGAFVAGSHGEGIWKVTASTSDFILKGAAFRTVDISGDYSWLLTKENSRFDLFLGPIARVAFYPQVRTSDGITLQTRNLTTASAGVQLSAQTKVDQYILAFAKLSYDLALASSQSVSYSASSSNYGGHLGLMFGQFWPLGIEGEIGYDASGVTTADQSAAVSVKQDRYSIQLGLSYIF